MLLLAAGCALLFVGCGKKAETGEEASEEAASSVVESIVTPIPVQVEETELSGAESPETEEEQTSEETGTVELPHGQVLHYEPIENVASLDATPIDYGYGPDRDELNRPVNVLEYNEKYGKYGVDFMAPTEEKIVYLSFDNGYENGYTPVILDTMKEKGVTGIFFPTLNYFEDEPELVRRMIDEGHIVGNHTVHHPSDGLPGYSMEYQIEEVQGLTDYVKEHFDYDVFLFRYPTGRFSEQSLAIVHNCNLRTVFWSFAYVDWITDQQMSPEEAMQKLLDQLHPGAIYLLHAVSKTNAEVLGQFIDEARARGYEFGDYRELSVIQ